MTATWICPAESADGSRSGDLGECNMWSSSDWTRDEDWREARVCVDLGRSASVSGRWAAQFAPHIVVLTHADGDHINGFTPYSSGVDKSGRLPRQLWVPYEWGLVWHSALATVGFGPEESDVPGGESPVLTGDDLLGLAGAETHEQTNATKSTQSVARAKRAPDDTGQLYQDKTAGARRVELPNVTVLDPWKDEQIAVSPLNRNEGPEPDGWDASVAPTGAPVDLRGDMNPMSLDELCVFGLPYDTDEAVENRDEGTGRAGERVSATYEPPSASAPLARMVRALTQTANKLPKTELQQTIDEIAGVIGARMDAAGRTGSPLPTGTARSAATAVANRALRICQILSWAMRRGVTIRYFSTDAIETHTPPPWERVGVPGVVTLVNALEVRLARIPIRDASLVLFRAVGLTTVNRRALVSFLWVGGPDGRAEHEAIDPPARRGQVGAATGSLTNVRGALIWSDSGGETCLEGAGVCAVDLTPWSKTVVMTAPHHGSDGEGHQGIWDAYEAHCRTTRRQMPVIVNGGQTHRRLAPTVQIMSAQLTACTYCKHHPRSHHQTVMAYIDDTTVTMTPRCADVIARLAQLTLTTA